MTEYSEDDLILMMEKDTPIEKIREIHKILVEHSKLKESYLERVSTANKIISEKIDEIKKLNEEKEELKRKIKHHIEVRAGETVYAVWRRELMEMID